MADDIGILKSGVYRIDLGNGWFYVGASQRLARRESQHHCELRRGIHCNKILQSVYNKYGQFSFTVLGRYPTDQIVRQEQDLLNKYYGDPKCANIALVVGKPTSGRKLPDDHRAKIQKAATGRKHSDETRAKISAVQRGRRASDETRAKMSAAAAGKKKPPFSAEHRSRISLAKTGTKATDATRAKMSASAFGAKRSPEHCAAISAARLSAAPRSLETRTKISGAMRAHHARLREAVAA